MKKITSILLAIIMVLSTFSLFAFAKEEKVPVVVLQGYSGPTLVYADDNGEPIIDPETGDVIKAWPVDFGKIEESEYEHFGELVLSFRQKLYEAFKARTSTIIDKSEIEEFYDKLIDCFGDDLWMGLNGELSSDPEYEPTNNQMLSHFLGIVGQDQNQFGSL